jgi:hypothetical protein
MIPCAPKTALPVEFPSRGTYMQRRFSKAWPLSEVAHALKLPACRAAMTSVPKEFCFSGARCTSLKLNNYRNVPSSCDSCPKGAFSSSHVEVNSIETEGQHFFS